MAAKRKTPSSNRRKKFVEEVLLQSVNPEKKIRRRHSPVQQLRQLNEERKYNKQKYLPKLHKKNKSLYTYVRKYKSAVARKYNKELVVEMKKRGYFKQQIKHAKNYSIVGKNVRLEVDNVVTRYNKSNTRALARGKWVTIEKARSLQKRAVRKARVESYMEILGVSKKKAWEILKEIDKNTPAAYELKALIY